MIKNIHHNRYKDFTSLIAGALVPLCLAPFNYAILAFVSSVLIIYSISNNTPKQAFKRGYLYGISMFGFGVSWLYISIHEHGNAHPLLAGGLTAALVLVLALFPALKVVIYKALENKNPASIYNKQPSILLLINLALIWAVFDWIQGWLFTGFPWLYLGYSQINTPLAGFAPLLSVFGVSALVIFCSGLIYLLINNLINFIKNNHNQYSLNQCLNYLVILTVGAILGSSLKAVEWSQEVSEAEKIVLVQGNIAQVNRWDPELYAQNIKTYEDLSQSHWSNSTIIWPESAISLPLPYSQDLIVKLKKLATSKNSSLIVGVPRLANAQHQYFNSVIAIGNGSGSHNKNKLVPWGEYVPFENILRGLIEFFNLPMSNFISGNDITPHFSTLQSSHIKWLPFICYEIAYPDYVIAHAGQGEAILTISNDAWFGHSIGPWQHLQLAQMRALETARPVIRATNNGITALIDTHGQITQQIPQFEAGVLINDQVRGVNGSTPIMRFGVSALILVFLGFIVLSWVCFVRETKFKKS